MTNTAWQRQYLKATQIELIDQQPHSKAFNDVYFNSQGGYEESKYVFIESNRLSERWQQQKNSRCFVIAETGFGTGLNFLTTWQAWQQTANKPRHLHFISCEKFPLALEAMQQAHSCFPELAAYSQQLLSLWQGFNDVYRSGLHSFCCDDSVTLTLAIGDATTGLSQLSAKVDAWYLDGFAPQKNPQMWDDKLFTAMNRLSGDDTTAATFTAASQVKKSLVKAGFKVTKLPGFGKKREMITATFNHHISNQPLPQLWHPLPPAKLDKQTVTILGGGIAGMCLAQCFKQAGYEVTVVEKNAQHMRAASGNDAAMVMPLLTAEHSPESAFYLRAFEVALRFYQADEFHAIGVAQSLRQKKLKRWAEAIQQADLPTHLVNINNDHLAQYPSAGYVDTRAVAARLQNAVDQWITCEIDQLKLTQNKQWQFFDHDQNVVHEADLLIVANGIKAQQLLSPVELYLTAKHGMTSSIKVADNHALNSIQLSTGYVIPSQSNNQWLCGATFDHLEVDDWYKDAVLHEDHWPRNLNMWQQHPLYDVLKNAQPIKGHAATRATTPDHLPICGPLIDAEQFKLDYHDLHHGRHWQSYPPAEHINNLYVLNGLGSRGFTSAPILAQYLCAMINAEPLPLEADLCKIIHPNRFLFRSLKKAPPQ